ncbi:DUF3304 domain-containing protein [Burkholderia sp. L27(2015)]|uniref:DUF3304 domain-containing protein n=1 Tax=Burkholderia sp. L27(2015) TaxID=1641858 RepID=UPI00131D24E0|nr:DUF3304 domain-containing protein [Burkholderia sp. L27(2015)]
MKNSINWISVLGLGFIVLASLAGCAKEPYMLGITGYNYTDRGVADFTVNGAGGGDIVLSKPTSGGGGLSCCVVLGKNTKTPFWINVEYQMDALETYSPRKEIAPAGPYIKTRVKVDGPIPADPEYLEIHFYQDHIEAAITGRDGPSPPRLKLQSRSDFAR